MDDINLKKAFEETYPADSNYWTFSANPRIQREQVQGVQGNRAAINVSTILNDTDIQEKKEKDDADFEQFAAAMGEAQRLFLEASQAAQFALNDLGNTLDTLQTELNQLREDFEQNTVTLSDGTQVYYNTDTARFERQDVQGDWQSLGEEDMSEAFQKAKAHGGMASTKQGKQALDEQQTALDGGFLFIVTQHDRLTEIDQAVKDGVMSVDEGSRQKQALTKEVEERTSAFEQSGREIPGNISPAAVPEQSASQSTYTAKGPQERENQTGSPEIETLFNTTEEPSTDTASPPYSGPMR